MMKKRNVLVALKKAFNPMPGANAYGTLANNPITNVLTTAATIVDRKTAWNGIPV